MPNDEDRLLAFRRRSVLDAMRHAKGEVDNHPLMPASAKRLLETMCSLLADYDNRITTLERAAREANARPDRVVL